jgi:hypothetical protein
MCAYNSIVPERIGPALVAEDVITAEQLKAALERQERHPSFLLGEIISILYRIPIELVDDVTVRRVVMPYFPLVLLTRLQAIVQRDKFAKGLRIDTLIADVSMRRHKYEIMHVESRDYNEVAGEDRFEKRQVKRYVLTEVNGDAILTLTNGDIVAGLLHLKHDSDSRELSIVEDEDQLKTALYYELRAIYNQKYAKRSPTP